MLEIFNSLLHIDVTLFQWAQDYGIFLYFILFLIIFCETGLVITPFLPGDSLLFAVGALCATQNFLDVKLIMPLLIFAAILGDTTNFFIGRTWGIQLFQKKVFFLKPSYLTMTEEFFQKKGVWAVSLSRFFPFIRTFAPFFAGLSKMPFKIFFSLSLLGSVGWIFIFVPAGYFFGRIEFVQKNFTILVMGIVAFSLTPLVIRGLKSYFHSCLLKKT